jgi:molecular chaperone DnaK (HSP70)
MTHTLQVFSPEEISAMILVKIKETAEPHPPSFAHCPTLLYQVPHAQLSLPTHPYPPTHPPPHTHTQVFSPQEISAMILVEMKETADPHPHEHTH